MLTGELTDQVALMGVLNTLYAMGFTLLKVERLECPPPSATSWQIAPLHLEGDNP